MSKETTKETTAAAIKYAEIRKQTDEQKDAEQIDLDVEQAENQIDTDLHHAKTVVVNRKKDLANAIRSIPFNTASIINAKRQLAIAIKDVEDIKALKTELF